MEQKHKVQIQLAFHVYLRTLLENWVNAWCLRTDYASWALQSGADLEPPHAYWARQIQMVNDAMIDLGLGEYPEGQWLVQVECGEGWVTLLASTDEAMARLRYDLVRKGFEIRCVRLMRPNGSTELVEAAK